MELLLYTANLAAIKKYNDYYNIVGVTTSPSILSKEKQPFYETYEKIRDIIGEEKQLHIQVTGRTCEEMIKEAETITKRFGKDIYIKVPVIEEGVKAMKHLHNDGYKLTATAVLTVQQAFLAGSVGADYVAVAFGAEETVDSFEDHLEEVYKSATNLYDEDLTF